MPMVTTATELPSLSLPTLVALSGAPYIQLAENTGLIHTQFFIILRH
jgi:hypothetical protein